MGTDLTLSWCTLISRHGGIIGSIAEVYTSTSDTANGRCPILLAGDGQITHTDVRVVQYTIAAVI